MRVLVYNDLDPAAIPGYGKVKSALEAGNFAQADVRKIGDNLYRARLDKRDRLLFRLHRHAGETCCLVLEHIRNHAYDRSRFLAGGAAIDESKIPPLASPEEAEAEPLVYLHPERERFNLLDKILSFDEDQQRIYDAPPPMVIIGSAGSGKTALTLEKMKEAIGDVLFVSLSPFLVHNARNLYYANGYENDEQAVDFLSFQELLESIRVPEGREIRPREFEQWFQRHRVGSGLKDAHKVYEEIRGVITAAVSERPWLTREAYLELGIRQSIFTEEERPRVYDLFEKYVKFLEAEGLYDSNIESHRYLELVEPRYDFLVVDEVQDITNVQLYLMLKSLREAGQFILSGDANQIVHPNFFSWSSVKSLFFEERELTGHGEVVRILQSNYRNSSVVTEVANRILKLKHARFGSVDRESNFLVDSVDDQPGRLQLLEDSEAVKRELDQRTARSTRVAVLVMHPEQKEEARQWFTTPLVFSVQEAKGLEYESIVLYNFVSGEQNPFREIASGVDASALEREALDYARARDKRDKSLEIYKFFINALYVAATRAVRHLYVVEANHRHPLLELLQLDRFTGELALEKEASSLEEWQHEARRLELQGKEEQAQAIRDRVLRQRPVPWPVLDRASFDELRRTALARPDKKPRLRLLESALIHYHLPALTELREAAFKPALQDEGKAAQQIQRNHYMTYELKHPGAVLKEAEKYGVDHRTTHNLTPLMVGAWIGNDALVEQLIKRGADPELTANNGFTALHFALERAATDAKYARQRLARIYPLLAPESVSVQVDGRLVKLDARLMETFLLQLLSAVFYRELGPAAARGRHGFTAPSIEALLAPLPESVLPARRKRRPYISSILAKNEVERADRYNRRIFVRTRHGHYVVNPRLKLRRGEEWVDYHELFRLEDLGVPAVDLSPHMHDAPPELRRKRAQYEASLRESARRRLEAFRDRVRIAAERSAAREAEPSARAAPPRSLGEQRSLF